MTGRQLKEHRKNNGLTQAEAAQSLGVSQTYFSLIESGARPLTGKLKGKVVREFDLRTTELPTEATSYTIIRVSDDKLTADLSALGYKGFLHLKPSRRKNPADVLLSALYADKRDARLVEALPWVVFEFADMKWDEVVNTAKVYDLQNRLGFVINVAKRMAESCGNNATAQKLETLETKLESSKLEKEETLCKETMTRAERAWLREQRPDEAKHWNLLTDLSPEHLNRDYYAAA